MKKDSINENIIDFNEYINSDNELSEEMLQAYLEAVEMETPDLWSKIEAGYDREVIWINNEKKLNKKRNKKTFIFIAAAIVITLIAVPIVFLGGNRGSKNDKAVFEESSDNFEMTEDVCDESVTEAQLEEDVYVENDMDMWEAEVEESGAQSDTEADSDEAPAESYTSNTNSAGEEEHVKVLEKVTIEYNEGEYYVYIGEGCLNFQEGTRIHITNKAVIESVIEENKIDIELEYVDVIIANLEQLDDADKDYTFAAEITDIHVSK